MVRNPAGEGQGGIVLHSYVTTSRSGETHDVRDLGQIDFWIPMFIRRPFRDSN